MEGSDLNALPGQLLCHVSCFYDVYSHPDMKLKRSSPNAPTPETTESCDLFVHFISNSSTDLFPSAEMHFRCLSNRAKTNTRERINFDVTQGKFIRVRSESCQCKSKKHSWKRIVSHFLLPPVVSVFMHFIWSKLREHSSRRSAMLFSAWCLAALCIKRVKLCIQRVCRTLSWWQQTWMWSCVHLAAAAGLREEDRENECMRQSKTLRDSASEFHATVHWGMAAPHWSAYCPIF